MEGTGGGILGPLTVGVLAVQGGVREHVDLLDAQGVRTSMVRVPADLVGPHGSRIDALVLPGGESSVIVRLMKIFDLWEPVRSAVAGGLPTLGTCAGMILLADQVLDPAPGQDSLHSLDITVQRNAFGSQVDSAEATVDTVEGPVSAAFIRAPVVTRVGAGVAVIARRREVIVGVRQAAITGLAFHPELTGETRFHERLIADATLVRAA